MESIRQNEQRNQMPAQFLGPSFQGMVAIDGPIPDRKVQSNNSSNGNAYNPGTQSSASAHFMYQIPSSRTDVINDQRSPNMYYSHPKVPNYNPNHFHYSSHLGYQSSTHTGHTGAYDCGIPTFDPSRPDTPEESSLQHYHGNQQYYSSSNSNRARSQVKHNEATESHCSPRNTPFTMAGSSYHPHRILIHPQSTHQPFESSNWTDTVYPQYLDPSLQVDSHTQSNGAPSPRSQQHSATFKKTYNSYPPAHNPLYNDVLSGSKPGAVVPASNISVPSPFPATHSSSSSTTPITVPLHINASHPISYSRIREEDVLEEPCVIPSNIVFSTPAPHSNFDHLFGAHVKQTSCHFSPTGTVSNMTAPLGYALSYPHQPNPASVNKMERPSAITPSAIANKQVAAKIPISPQISDHIHEDAPMPEIPVAGAGVTVPPIRYDDRFMGHNSHGQLDDTAPSPVQAQAEPSTDMDISYCTSSSSTPRHTSMPFAASIASTLSNRSALVHNESTVAATYQASSSPRRTLERSNHSSLQFPALSSFTSCYDAFWSLPDSSKMKENWIAANSDHVISVFDSMTVKGAAMSLSLSPCGQYLACSTHYGQIYVFKAVHSSGLPITDDNWQDWESIRWVELTILQPTNGQDTFIDECWNVKWTPDGKHLIAGGARKDRFSYDSQDDDLKVVPSVLFIFHLYDEDIFNSTESPNSILHDSSSAPMHFFPGHEEEITCIEIVEFPLKSSQYYLLTGSQDGYIRKWKFDESWRTLKHTTPFDDQSTYMIFDLCLVPFSNDPTSLLLIAAADNGLKVYDFETEELLHSFPMYDLYCTSVSFTTLQSPIAAGSEWTDGNPLGDGAAGTGGRFNFLITSRGINTSAFKMNDPEDDDSDSNDQQKVNDSSFDWTTRFKNDTRSATVSKPRDCTTTTLIRLDMITIIPTVLDNEEEDEYIDSDEQEKANEVSFELESVRSFQSEWLHCDYWPASSVGSTPYPSDWPLINNVRSFTSNGKYLMCPGRGGFVAAWNIETGKLSAFLSDHSENSAVRSVVFHPFWPFLITCSDDSSVQFYRPALASGEADVDHPVHLVSLSEDPKSKLLYESLQLNLLGQYNYRQLPPLHRVDPKILPKCSPSSQADTPCFYSTIQSKLNLSASNQSQFKKKRGRPRKYRPELEFCTSPASGVPSSTSSSMETQ